MTKTRTSGIVWMKKLAPEGAAAADASPLQAERQWLQQAEDNVVERLQNAGLLAPEGVVQFPNQAVVERYFLEPGTGFLQARGQTVAEIQQLAEIFLSTDQN